MTIESHRRCTGQLANSLKVLGLPAAEYHADIDIQSCSQLKAMLDSPAEYQLQFTRHRAGSAAMSFGTLVHTLVLEPHLFPRLYAVYPDKRDGRDTAVKEFVRQHPGKTVIDEIELQQARMLGDRLLHRRIRLRGAVTDPGRPFGRFLEEAEREVTLYYDDPVTHVRCRARLDVRHPDALFDLKTAADIGREAWLRSALRLHYDMQAYMYCLADCLYEGRSQALPFVFLAAQSDAPHSVSVFTAGGTFLREGAAKYASAVGAYEACRSVELWPDAGEDGVLELEPWQARAEHDPAWRRALVGGEQ